jgi:soluble lytic murein transglycosylase-like protein
MKIRIGVAFLVALACSLAAGAVVRIQVRDGKTIVYNDGIGEASHAALAESDSWLASRIRIPSLYDGLIDSAAEANAIDPKLVKSVMLIESAFNPVARSRKGARGLMQLMPETAVRYGVSNIVDPAQNISGGTRYLRDLLGLFGGDLAKSLAAYNAGENAVLRYGGVPPYQETQLYVRKGLTAYYGKSTALGGGFGLPSSQTWAAPGRRVRVTRDKNNRPVITTELASRATRRS